METLSKRPEELVDCWHDKQRMDFLFSSFPTNVSANPEHWQSKMSFWKDLITKLCENCNSVSIDMNLIAKWLQRDGRQPMGLQLVWDTMIREGMVVSADEFVGDMARNSSWVGWGLNMFVRKPALWMAGKMLNPLKTLSPVKTVEQKKSYICVHAFQQKCQKLMRTLQTCKSKTHGQLHILPLHELNDFAKDIVRETKELEMLLLALERDKKVVVFYKSEVKSSEKFVKFAKHSDECVTPVNEGDLGVVKLEYTKRELEKEISSLYAQQNELLSAIKQLIHFGERARAKTLLRQKQRLQLNVKGKETSLDNIQQLLFRLEQCGTDQMVMDAYKAGVSAYKEATKSMTIDDADSTMDNLQAALDDHEQITTTLSTPLEDDVITEDLEKELDELLALEELEINQIAKDVTRPTAGLPSRSSKSSLGAATRLRSDELVSSQTDADIAKLVTGMAATNMREQTSSKSSQGKRIAQALS